MSLQVSFLRKPIQKNVNYNQLAAHIMSNTTMK